MNIFVLLFHKSRENYCSLSSQAHCVVDELSVSVCYRNLKNVNLAHVVFQDG